MRFLKIFGLSEDAIYLILEFRHYLYFICFLGVVVSAVTYLNYRYHRNTVNWRGESARALTFWFIVLSALICYRYESHYKYYEAMTRPFRPYLETYLMTPAGTSNQPFVCTGKIIPINRDLDTINHDILETMPVSLRPASASEVKFALWIHSRGVFHRKYIGNGYYKGYYRTSEISLTLVDLDTKLYVAHLPFSRQNSVDVFLKGLPTDFPEAPGAIPIPIEAAPAPAVVEEEKAPKTLESRVIRLPMDNDIGFVSVRKENGAASESWKSIGAGLGKNRGPIMVDKGDEAKLEILTADGGSFSFLKKIDDGSLQEIDVFVKSFDDRDLENMAHLENLIALNLRGTSVSDACEKTLIGFKNLRRLDISKTQISLEGLERLKNGLKNCDIYK